MAQSWDNFFIMAGTAAATLIGLLFVSITVGTGFSRLSVERGTRGFLTPTLVHFGGVLFQTLAVQVPWPSALPAGIIFGLGGLAGLAYECHVIIARRAGGFVMHGWHDWLPYVAVPALGDVSLIVGALGIIARKSFAPYAIAGASMLLLFAGLYGAWDLTVWILTHRDIDVAKR
jgi:hypothetical protein